MVAPHRPAANARPRAAAGPKPSSQYTGLTWDGNTRTWRVRINARSQQHHVGRFRDIAEAAQTYDCAALLLLGPAAAVNFGAAAAGAAMPRFLARIGPAALKKLQDAAVLAQQLDGIAPAALLAPAGAAAADPSAGSAAGMALQGRGLLHNPLGAAAPTAGSPALEACPSLGTAAPQPAFAAASPSPLGPGPFPATTPAGAACWGSYWQQAAAPTAAACPTPGPSPPTPLAACPSGTEMTSAGLPLEPLGSMCSLGSACSSQSLDASGTCSSGGSFSAPTASAGPCGFPSLPSDWAGGAAAAATVSPGYASGDATMTPAWCPLDDELDKMLWQLESSAPPAASAQQQPLAIAAAAALPANASRCSFGPVTSPPVLQQQQQSFGGNNAPNAPISALYWQWATEGPDGTTCAVDLRCFH